jgi:hypothetical protein
VNRRTLLVSLGLGTAALLAALAVVGDLSARIPLALALWGSAHALYLAASWVVLRRPGTVSLALVVAAGLVPRLLFLPAAPSLSEDLHRYLWDGRLVAHGINPFALPPSDPALARFHDGLYRGLNHAEVPTIYPPAAQLLFGAASAAGGTPLAWKGVLFALEGLLVAALVALLRRRRLAPERLLLYYWNPLVVVECYGSGHLDLAAAAFLLAALALAEARRLGAAGLAFGAAVATKLVPLLLVPALLRRGHRGLLAAAALLTAALYVPFLPAGGRLLEGLRIYARHWEFNGPLYTLLRPHFASGDGPRLLLALGLAAASAAVAWRARSLSGAALATGVAFLLFSPTVYPWYLAPLVALLPLHPDPGLLLLSGTAALTYLPLPEFRATGVWALPAWILWVEYGGPLAAWGRSLAGPWIRRAARRAGSTPAPRTESPPGRERGTEADRTGARARARAWPRRSRARARSRPRPRG